MPVREPPHHPLSDFPPDLTFPAGHSAAPGRPPRWAYKGMWLAIVLVVLVVFAAIGAVAYLTYRLVDQTSQNERLAEHTRVVEPAELGTLGKARDAESVKLVNDLRTDLPSEVIAGTSSQVIAAYGSPKAAETVMVIAFGGAVPKPQAALDSLLRSMAGESAVLVRIEPGPLGGYAKCSNDKLKGVPFVACAWSDSGSLGLLMYFGKPFDDQLKQRFVADRGRIERRDVT
jgi:hypothetical protein